MASEPLKKPEGLDRFAGLLGKLVHVPKREIKREVRKFKKRKAKKRKEN